MLNMLNNIDLSQSINIAIMGRGNTGKSSLMNALLKLSRREALQVSKVGVQTHLTKDFVIQKFFNNDVYLIDTPPIHDEYFENHKIINIINDIDLVILVVDGYPVYGHKYIFQKLSIYKSNVFVVLNGMDKWDNCFSDWINYTVSQWANYLNIDKIYLTCTRGYNPTENNPQMDIRGVDLLRQDINNFIETKNREKQTNILEQLAIKVNTNNNNQEILTSKYTKKTFYPLEFEWALKSCKKTAYKSYEVVLEYNDKINHILKNLISRLDKKISMSNKNKELEKSFDKVISEIKQILNKDIDELKLSLAKKKQNLEDYSIVLFGRTRAGKSTIREALTKGDGSTIGKGGQRTTRDVQEYRWNHLRLIDTPGIDAYEGEEDTQKANRSIDEADMVLFLTSDDSVQPSEFEQMGRLSHIEKPFIILLNVKGKLENETQIKRFLAKPEKTFDEERLSGHHNHIKTYVKQHLTIEEVTIIDIHARAGFLSNQSEYQEYKTELWQLSKLDKVYSIIAEDIYKNGHKRRASTFFDGTKVLIENIEKQLSVRKKDIDSQIKFLYIKEKEVKKLLADFMKDTEQKIDSEIKVIFSQFKQEIPAFVDHAVGNRNADEEWKMKQNRLKNKLEQSIKRMFETMIKELKEKLLEFEQEYSYDSENINFTVNFDNLNQGMFGNILKNLSFILKVIGAGVIIFNPAAWVIGAGFAIGDMIFSFFSGKVKEDEKRKLNQQKEKMKNEILPKVNKQEQELITKLKREVKSKLQEIEKDILSPSEFSHKELSFINQQLLITQKEIQTVLNNLQTDHQLIQQISNNS